MKVKIMICGLVAVLSTQLAAFQQPPGYFLSPPPDNNEELFAIGVGQTEEAAFAIAMASLVQKVTDLEEDTTKNFRAISENTDEMMSSVSEGFQNKEILRFNVRGLTKDFSEENRSTGYRYEEFSQAIQVYYKSDDQCSFLIKHYEMYSDSSGVVDEYSEGTAAWENCAFSHAKRFMNENPEISYTGREVAYYWYVIVSLKTSAIRVNEE